MQSASHAHGSAPHFQYDPNFGDRDATYTSISEDEHAGQRPELPGRFVAYVDGETMISTMHGAQPRAWHAQPGTPCLILGRWSDGTVHVKWRAIAGNYTVDARFPDWVVTEDPEARMAGGGRILPANNPPRKRAAHLSRLLSLLKRVFLG
jgi:hypothetical protein